MPSEPKSELLYRISEHFVAAGYPPEHARQIPDILAQTFFNATVEADADMIDASWLAVLSFGGRHDELSNVSIPGPQNEALAELVSQYYVQRPRLVCAQWEVALALEEKISATDLIILHPKIDPMTGRLGHYSTQAVLTDIISSIQSRWPDAKNSTVGLIAHRYHLPRVIDYARKLGLKKLATPPSRHLPCDFDPKCYVPWCRDFRGFFMSQAISWLAHRRNLEYLQDT